MANVEKEVNEAIRQSELDEMVIEAILKETFETFKSIGFSDLKIINAMRKGCEIAEFNFKSNALKKLKNASNKK